MNLGKSKEVIKCSIHLLALFSLVGVTLLAACSQHEPQLTIHLAQPRIHFDQDVVDVGTVLFGERLTYTFHFSNTGDALLIIGNISAPELESCCPPQPAVGSATLQPGEESTLSIETAPADGHLVGSHLFEITVESNDPVEPEKILRLKAYFES